MDVIKVSLDVRKKELGKDLADWAAKLKPEGVPAKLKPVISVEASKRTDVQKMS